MTTISATELWKSLKPPIVSFYFAKKIANGCNNLSRHVQANIEMQCIELVQFYLNWTFLFSCNFLKWSSGKVLQASWRPFNALLWMLATFCSLWRWSHTASVCFIACFSSQVCFYWIRGVFGITEKSDAFLMVPTPLAEMPSQTMTEPPLFCRWLQTLTVVHLSWPPLYILMIWINYLEWTVDGSTEGIDASLRSCVRSLLQFSYFLDMPDL